MLFLNVNEEFHCRNLVWQEMTDPTNFLRTTTTASLVHVVNCIAITSRDSTLVQFL